MACGRVLLYAVRAVTLLRSLLFNLVFQAATLLMGLASLPLLLGPRRLAHGTVRLWARFVLGALGVIAGLRYRVEGLEHLPQAGPLLVAAKHQSAFDTIVWLTLVPDAAYVLKRELLRIPIYGWFARKAGMIAVDRAAGAAAMRGLVRDGRQALAEGRQVVIFPEGTRMPPGVAGRYQPGVAGLVAGTDVPVLPVATDSGRFWGRNAFLKHPGRITVRILPPLTAGLAGRALVTALRDRIEAEQRVLGA